MVCLQFLKHVHRMAVYVWETIRCLKCFYYTESVKTNLVGHGITADVELPEAFVTDVGRKTSHFRLIYRQY